MPISDFWGQIASKYAGAHFKTDVAQTPMHARIVPECLVNSSICDRG